MKCWRFLLSWSSYSINLLLFPSPRGPLARVIKRDVITRHGGTLQLQPPRNSPSIRQQSRQREGEKRKKMARERGREMGDKRDEKIWAREEGDKEKKESERGPKHEGERKLEIEKRKSNSGWTGADLSWPAIRRTSRPWRLLPSGSLTSAKSSALWAPVGVKLPLTGPQRFSMLFS